MAIVSIVGMQMPRGMQQFRGKFEYHLKVSGDVRLYGLAARGVTVVDDGLFDMVGMVAGGDLVIEPGGTALVRGMVTRNVVNAGMVEIAGSDDGVPGDVKGVVITLAGGRTFIRPGAWINGQEQT